jgi:hypothetical protein
MVAVLKSSTGDRELSARWRISRDAIGPLVDEATFYRAQAVLDGRVVVAGPPQRNHLDFPLRGFVRCEICGRPLRGSWSKGRTGHYARTTTASVNAER